MRTKRFLALTAMSLMAVALIAAAGCGSDTPASGGVDNQSPSTPAANVPGPVAQSTTPAETEVAASLGMPAPGSEDDEKIVVLDGALEDGGHDDSDEAPVTEGERGERVLPGDVKVQDLPERDPAETRLNDAEGGEGDSDTRSGPGNDVVR